MALGTLLPHMEHVHSPGLVIAAATHQVEWPLDSHSWWPAIG
jgi:hypothetical protein